MCSIYRFMIGNMRFRLMLMHIQYDFYFPNFILQMVCVFCHINAGLLLSLYFNVVMIRTRLFYGPKSFSSERRPNKQRYHERIIVHISIPSFTIAFEHVKLTYFSSAYISINTFLPQSLLFFLALQYNKKVSTIIDPINQKPF